MPWRWLCVWLGLLGGLGFGVSACTFQSQKSLLTSKPAAKDTATALVGQWQPDPPPDDWNLPEKKTLIFTAEGDFYLLSPTSPNKDAGFKAVRGEYWINPNTQPMQIDLPPSTVFPAKRAIFEFMNDGKLHLEADYITWGEVRPAKFLYKKPLFRKVSNQTVLPANTQVTDSRPSPAGREAAVQTYLGLMRSLQQQRFFNSGQFASSLEELTPGLSPEDGDYRYQINAQPAAWVVLTAAAKRPDLKSYTVTMMGANRGSSSFMCETVLPSAQPPDIVAVPPAGGITGAPAFDCGPNSRRR